MDLSAISSAASFLATDALAGITGGGQLSIVKVSVLLVLSSYNRIDHASNYQFRKRR